MSIIVQVIEVQWTKKSRGAPNSTLRNAVSENYPFGKHELGSGVFVQKIKYSEFSGFDTPIVSDIKAIAQGQQRQMKLGFVSEGETLSVLSWGIPLREDYRKEKNIGNLVPNTWLKVVGNVRTSWESTWVYYKYVYNIFYGKPVMFDEVVLNRDPVNVYIDKSNLW